MKKIFALIFLLGLQNIHAQAIINNADSIAKIIESAKDRIQTRLKFSSKEQFFNWFFSEDFEKYFKQSGGSSSIGVGYKGFGLKFGGDSSDQTAWENRKSDQNIDNWSVDINQTISIDSATISIEKLVALERVIALLAPPSIPDLVSIEQLINPVNGPVTCILTLHPDSPDILIRDLSVIGGLKLVSPPNPLAGSTLTGAGIPLAMTWIENETRGVILVSLEKGNSIALDIPRNIEANLPRQCIWEYDYFIKNNIGVKERHRAHVPIMVAPGEQYFQTLLGLVDIDHQRLSAV